jgi:hypothetical protein
MYYIFLWQNCNYYFYEINNTKQKHVFNFSSSPGVCKLFYKYVSTESLSRWQESICCTEYQTGLCTNVVVAMVYRVSNIYGVMEPSLWIMSCSILLNTQRYNLHFFVLVDVFMTDFTCSLRWWNTTALFRILQIKFQFLTLILLHHQGSDIWPDAAVCAKGFSDVCVFKK